MKSHLFPRLGVLLLILLSTTRIATAQPNVLFIAVDDLRPELGCYGVEGIHSPNIDRLAASGVRFDRAYCQLAVCNPSRVSLLTGLRPDSAKVWRLDQRFRHTVPDAVTLPQHFKQHGYITLGFGKIFHNPWPDDVSWSEPHSWPENSQLWSDGAKQALKEFKEKMHADGRPDSAINRLRAVATEIVDLPDSDHIDGAIADQTLAAMRRLAKKDEPFFLAAGFVRPHLPFVVPKKYWDLYERDQIPLVENPKLPTGAPDFAMNTMYELRDYMDFLGTADPRDGSLTEAQQRELKHGYYAAVSFIDAQVGRLLDELESLGLADDTIVVLWGDHGWKLGDHNSWCKQTNYEIDARVPLIIHDPRNSANGRVSKALVEFVDVYPTLCDLAGVPVGDHLEGTSLRPLLDGSAKKVKDAAFSQFPRRDGKLNLMGYAMRTDRYRYIEWIDRKNKKPVAHELYDHQSDPDETTNLAKNGETAALLEQLSKQLWSLLPEPPDFKPEHASGTAAAKPNNERPSLIITNDGRKPVTVYWLPENGPRKKVGTVGAGQSITQRTTLGHRFLIEDVGSSFSRTLTVEKRRQVLRLTAGAAKPKADAPNIVVIMGDDWSWPHASILGDPVAKTPTFDRIAREGVLFENAFVSSPSCTPSRFAVASGQYHWRLGEAANLGGSLAADVPVYADLLARSGYRTGFCRKGAAPSKHSYRGNDPFGDRFKNFDEFFGDQQADQPFCFWYGAGEPHRPYDWQASLDSDLDLNAIEVPPYLSDNQTTRTDLGDYYLRVQKLDQLAGAILDRLEKAGELENTIVVMTGDNGMPFPRAKATLYDSGTRVPLAIRWGKKVKGGRSIGNFISLTDLAPTFLEACGLKVPPSMTGRSLLPDLTSKKSGQIDPAHNFVLTGMEQHVYPYPARALRTADYLYIRNFSPQTWPSGRSKGEPPVYDFHKNPWPTSSGAFSHNIDPGPTKQWMLHSEAPQNVASFATRPEEELFDLKADPHQLNNLAGDPAHADTRKALAEQLIRELRASGDPRFELADHSTFEVLGWTIHLHDRLWIDQADATTRMLELFHGQLQRVVDAVPAKALTHLRQIPIWIHPPYEGIRPSAEYHPQADWLKDNDRNPAMAKAIEITNVANFPFENRRMPYVMLHELAHGYHDRVLDFDDTTITAAFERARDSSSYDNVERFDGNKMVRDKAYAMSNHKEYFAEITEAYFGKNDFFPFDRNELKAHDPQGLRAVEKVWGIVGP
jgi:arylsulfatase A-like enzyme